MAGSSPNLLCTPRARGIQSYPLENISITYSGAGMDGSIFTVWQQGGFGQKTEQFGMVIGQ